MNPLVLDRLKASQSNTFYRKKSDFSNFRIIGLFVYYYNAEIEIDSNRRIKLDSKIRQIRLIGYGKGFSQYRIWNSVNDKIEEVTFIRINESDYIIILEKLKEQEMILFLFNESEDFLFNNKMIKILISSINFDRDEYELLFIFIYYCSDVLALIKMDESDINKKFINLK
jgi:hypothetical protein